MKTERSSLSVFGHGFRSRRRNWICFLADRYANTQVSFPCDTYRYELQNNNKKDMRSNMELLLCRHKKQSFPKEQDCDKRQTDTVTQQHGIQETELGPYVCADGKIVSRKETLKTKWEDVCIYTLMGIPVSYRKSTLRPVGLPNYCDFSLLVSSLFLCLPASLPPIFRLILRTILVNQNALTPMKNRPLTKESGNKAG